MNLLGCKLIYMENNKQVHHFLDFITEDTCNDAYLTICCLDWMLSEVFHFVIYIISKKVTPVQKHYYTKVVEWPMPPFSFWINYKPLSRVWKYLFSKNYCKFFWSWRRQKCYWCTLWNAFQTELMIHNLLQNSMSIYKL